MKETGIIMSGDHPIKCMDGTKTMTRRTAGLEKINDMPYIWHEPRYDKDVGIWLFWQKYTGDVIHAKCPYGGVGDRLWIRESYATRADGVHQILYRADYNAISKMLDLPDFCERWGYPQISIAWKPSIHMFRKDSRGTLDITALRLERLQEITPEDCLREGLTLNYEPASALPQKFQTLWDSLNGKKYPWAGNYWVWVISF